VAFETGTFQDSASKLFNILPNFRLIMLKHLRGKLLSFLKPRLSLH